MSGGRLVVLDRAGRDGKRFPLAEGLATLGCDPACDIRIMLPTVSPHHATVVVHANQTVIRNVCADETLVNGRGVSVAALRHGDVISIGGRHLRWEYADPDARRPQAPEPALHLPRRKPRTGRRGSGPAPARARDPQLQLKLELEHRASMPGSAGGKQVAIVQPQRRDTSDQIDKNPPRTPQQANKRPRTSKSDLDTSIKYAEQEKSKRSSSAARLHGTTQATLWIESRKGSPRAARKPTPLRLAVLKRHSMRVTKIEGPLQIDHTKQAAIRLMTGHTPKSKPSSPSFVVKKPSPVRRTPRSRSTRSSPSAAPGSASITPGNTSATPGYTSATPGNTSATPGNTSGTPGNTSRRRSGANRTVTILEITDSDGRNSSVRNSYASRRSTQKSPRRSAGAPSPRRSASAPSPRRSASVPSPTRSAGAPSPRRSAGAPSPKRSDGAPSPRRSAGAPSPKRSDGAPSPRRSAGAPSPSRSDGAPSPRKSAGAPSPRKSAGAPSPRKSAGAPSPRKSAGAPSPRKSAGAPSPRKSAGAPSPRKSAGAPSPRKSAGAPSPRKSAGAPSPRKSAGAPSPRKSALKDPAAKRGSRKTESIKFDLSNLESHSHDTDVVMLSDSTRSSRAADSASDDDVTLRYSESSAQSPSPSPRRSIHSRSSRILEQSLGSSLQRSPPARAGPRAPRPQRSARGSLIVQRALGDSASSAYSRRSTQSVTAFSTRTLSPRTQSVTAFSTRTLSPRTQSVTAISTRTLSPRMSRHDLESYSIVDLVSVDTDESALSTSVYGSADSTASTAFGTPQNSTRRKTRSTLDPTLLGSSTPYVKGRRSTPRSRSDPSPQNSSKTSANITRSTIRSSGSKRSKSLSTPENTEDAKKHISVNSSRVPRRSRLRDSSLLLHESSLLLHDSSLLHDDASPRTSRRPGGAEPALAPSHSPAQENGVCTPENRHSPEEASTPVLSIQSLLDSSQNSFSSQKSTRKGRPSYNTKRKTIGGVPGPKTRVGAKSKSLSFSARKTRLRLSSGSEEILNKNDDSEIVTPKSAVKLVPEGVKNKHSTAKKPQSKRSIIDDLNESDIVKQLFNSPVKRKLSQSMTEFSRQQQFDDDGAVGRRPTRRSVAAARTPDASLLDHTESYTPEIFVSPISTPTRSPSLEGIKLMFAKTTPENDLRDVRGVKGLLRTPRTRKSIKNDLTDVTGVKQIFAKSPKNRLSDVRVKEVFVSSPKNDLRRVTGVKSLFQGARTRKSPRNELDDVRGVKKLFNAKSPANDLRNVSGVKRTLRRQSPKNDLSDVRGVKRVFRRERRNDLSDVSGVEELFNLSNYSSMTVSTRAESLFDQLVGKPQKRAVYSKTFSSKNIQKTKGPRAKSLHASLDQVTASDNNWLEQELNKRLQIKNYLDSLKSANTSKANRSKQSKTKSLHALDEVADVDVLLEQQLNNDQHINNYLQSMRSVNDSKANKSKANKSNANKSSANRSKVNRSKAQSSVSKANMSRELQKLATDTVEGEAPLLTSRVRNSSVVYQNESDSERKKSASELYSAHTLPLKKRSLAEPSAAALLPLKKRALLHSTPVKGRPLRAMDESGLARVSPIRADDDTRYTAQDTSITSTQTKEITEVRPKSTRGTRANTENQETSNAPELVKPSPKKTRGRSKVASPKAKLASPVKEKAIKAKRASDDTAKDASPVKTRNAVPAKAKKSSPAKTKKSSPAKANKASPAKDKKASPAKAKKSSPAKTKKTIHIKTTKASPAKAKKASPTKAKKASPIKTKKESLAKSKAVSPVTKASPAKKLASPVPVKATRSRRNNASTLESNIKKRRASLVVAKKSPVMSPKPRATRKRKEPETTSTPVHSAKKSRATRKNTSVKDDKPKTPKSTRAKVHRATVRVVKPSPQLKPRAGRRPQADHSAQESKETTRKTRKTVTVQETQPESPKKTQAQRKSGKTQAAEVQPKTRGRKAAVSDSKDTTEVEQPEPKTKRGRKTDEPVAKKNNTQEKSIEEAKPVKTRGKKVETQGSVESAPSTRGRRGAKPDSVAPVVNTTTRKRKSDTAPENELPPKVRKSKEVAERGRKQTTEAPMDTKSTRNKSARKESKAEEEKLTRGRKTARLQPQSVPTLTEQKTRGTQANIENIPANQATGKRKRAAEPSPVQQRNTRAARGTAPPAGKPAGRSRRR